jgi:glycerophosphoryl diester phosphodiesterase
MRRTSSNRANEKAGYITSYQSKLSLMKTVFCLLAFALFLAMSCSPLKKSTINNTTTFDFEAHRGGRGLMPENTIPAMKNAIDLGVTTLEMDVVISKDRKVVVSHDPFFNEYITTTPGGKYLSKQEASEHPIYQMTYDSIRKFDVGLKLHPDFTKQRKVAAYKPLLSELIDSSEAYAKTKGHTIRYNIEIKSNEKFDSIRHPDPPAFSELLMQVLKDKNILDRTTIQSFDVRPLQYLHKTYPAVTLSYLVEKTAGTFQEQLGKLGFVPNIYSPQYAMLTKEMVEQSHAKQMKVVPWTVNTVKEMNTLIEMGVDGIISDYPDLIVQVSPNKK